MSRWVKWIIALNLLVLTALAFLMPSQMLSPGPVRPAHAQANLQGDCFACHAPFRGTASTCIACHKWADIGRVTTTGQHLPKQTPFHQGLSEQTCAGCHIEHAGTRKVAGARPLRFDHSLLRTSDAENCSSCHKAPVTPVHKNSAKLQCTQCHTTQAWTPARFDHATLSASQRSQCSTCHTSPKDRLHAASGSNCASCHLTKAWKPATFDHSKYFSLTGPHRTECATCHVNNDTSRYTCYGCHEHTPANIRAQHVEEGIRDFVDCVACHGGSSNRSRGGEREGDDD